MTPEKKVGIPTAEERAKFMALQIIKFAETGERGKKTLTRFILDELRGAEREAYERGLKEGLSCPSKEIQAAYKRGFNEAMERVLKEAAPYCPDGVKDCTCSVSYFVDVIRALKPGE